jgi:hypothetical protein
MGTSSSYSSPVIFTTLAARNASQNTVGSIHDVLVYPNPASAIATLQFNADKAAEATLHFFDLAGREVRSGSFRMEEGKNGLELNLSDLPRGIYLVVVLADDNSIARVNLIVE